MNICFISSHELDPTFGGTERVSFNLSQEMMQRGHNVYCCYLFNVPNEDFVSSVSSVKLPSVDCAKVAESGAFLAQYITDNAIDVLMFQSHHSIFWDVCVEAKRLTGVKLIYNLHSDPRAATKEIKDRFAKIKIEQRGVARAKNIVWNAIKLPYTFYLRNSYFKQMYVKIYRECDKFVLLSDHFMPIVKNLLGIDVCSKICAITNPMLPFDTIVTKRRKQIVFVGRMVFPNKRPDRVIDAWREVHNHYHEWSLVMIGGGEALEPLKRYVKEKGIERVKFTGSTNPMPYYSESAISCVTSSHEGFGMVIIEAQQNGCVPVVYDSYESLHDIIEDGKNGYIVRAFDRDEYVARLRELMDNEQLRETMSAACRERTDKFDVCTIVDKWEGLFKSLLS